MIRLARAADHEFLLQMFVEAVLWRPDAPKVALEELRRDPRLAAYLRDWDVALVAEEDGVPAGAAWFLRFTADAPGYGFVAEEIPELGLAVVRGRRGRGIGRALLRELQHAAREYPALSLSVHADNPARRLYEACGFVEVGKEGSAVTMVWRW